MVLTAAAPRLMDVAWRSLVTLVAAPWLLALRWLAWASGLQLSFLTSLGVAPAGFAPQAKVRELDAMLAHMHLREDQYRRVIGELQEAVEAREGDRKKALRSLKKVRVEVEVLAEQLAQLQDQRDSGGQPDADSPAGATVSPARGLHASVALLTAAALWYYQQDQPALQRKLVFTVLSPLAWVYLSTLLSRGKAQQAGTESLVLLLCAVWALLGFIAGSTLTSTC